MKIGIDISQVVYPRGVGRYTKELVGHLLKIDQRNQYILFGSSLRQQQALKNFIDYLKPKTLNLKPKLYPIPPTISEFLFNRIRLSIDPFVGRIDVFHSSDWTQPATIAKKVTTVHDLAPVKFPKLHDKKIVEVHKRRLDLVKKEVDKIIAVSANTKKDLIEILKIRPEKIVVIYEAASASFGPKSEEEINKAKNKFKIRKDYILTVATQGVRKNLARLYEAYEEIKKDFDLDLVIVGSTKGNEKEGVTKTGFLEDDELAALYSGAAVFVYPSFYEGFGLPVLEAMACGTPVVCSNTSSLPEVAEDAAVYVNPNSEESIAEGVMKVLMNKKIVQRLVKSGFEQANKFSWEQTAKKTLEVYQSLV